MRHRFTTCALVMALAATACSEAPTSSVRPIAAVLAETELEDFIQSAIEVYLPKGFEAAVDARWSNVRRKKNEGDVAGAIQEFNKLSLWIDKKTPEITIPSGEPTTKAQAAALIIVNMGRWLYEGMDADPLAVPTGDVAVEIVPAGAPLALVVPSQHASVRWDAGATQEERVVVVLEDPGTYPAQCQGPLDTKRCQYPLFYKFESFPDVKLQTPGRAAVCLVTTGDRRAIEYPEDDEPAVHGPVGERLRLAHDLPENVADRHPDGIAEGGIEILPLSDTQSELTNCDAPSTLRMSPLEKGLYLAMRFLGDIVSPKSAHAYDQGPEHEFTRFSNFNGVDPNSVPDVAPTELAAPASAGAGQTVAVSFRVANVTRRSSGDGTASSPTGTARFFFSSDAVLDEADDEVPGSEIAFGSLVAGNSSATITQNITVSSEAGAQFLFVMLKLDGEDGLAECDTSGETEFPVCYEGNNATSVPITIVDGFIGIWNGLLAPPGAPEGSGQPATLIITSTGEGCEGEFRVASAAGLPAYNATRTLTECSIDGSSLFAAIEPWSSPFNNAFRSEFAVTRSGTTVTGTATRFFPPPAGSEEPGQDNPPWNLILTLGTTPSVPLPPPPVIGLKATMSSGSSTLY